MHNYQIDNPKNSLILFQLDKHFNNLVTLFNSDNLPKVLMLSGKKGIGKFTLVNHFLSYLFDKDNYDIENKRLSENSKFYNLNKENLHPSIIYLSGSLNNNIKVDDIRHLKSKIYKSSLSSNKRFIIFDDIELFNNNSLNALLKIIEEPKTKDHFILINNKTKGLIRTIYSRSIEIKIFLNDISRIKIIKNLINHRKQKVLIDYESLNITPGNFLIYNEICSQKKLNLNENFLENMEIILNLYKKEKNSNYIKLLLFYTELYFSNLKKENNYKIEQISDKRIFVLTNINKFINNTVNQKTLSQIINNNLFND